MLQDSKNASTSFSLVQLLGDSTQGRSHESFALLLQKFGIDAKALSSNKQGSALVDFTRLKGAGVDAILPPQEGAVLKEGGLDIEALLQGFETEGLEAESDVRALNPIMLQHYGDDDVKQMMVDAKAFLKTQIADIAKAQGITLDIEALPKTLQSLTTVAEKIGVPVTKITLETLQSSVSDNVGNRQVAVLRVQQKGVEYSTQDLVRLKHDHGEQQVKAEGVKVAQEASKQEPLRALLHVPEKSLQTAILDESKKGRSTVRKPLDSDAVVPSGQLSTLSKAPVSRSMPTDVTGEMQSVSRFTERITAASNNVSDADVMAKISSLFGAQKQRNTTADEPKQEAKSVTAAHTQNQSVALELKVKEAKQTVLHFASNLKEAVENYKPPFTRLTMQLNPANLGEVDVTMIQRGSNVHINISSNNSAIAVLAQHSVELKNQLANNGLGNATMQFNTGGGEQQRQSQHQHNMSQAYEKYANSESDETVESFVSLDLIIPQYV